MGSVVRVSLRAPHYVRHLHSTTLQLKMGSTHMYLLTLLVATSMAATREEREDCGQQFASYSTCLATAASSISDVAPDGKPDVIERKGCNVLEALNACNSKLTGSCNTAEVKNMMNQQMTSMIQNLETLPGWDSNKCPAAKSFLAGGAAGMMVSVPLIALVVARLLA